jgi:hypothetical protein
MRALISHHKKSIRLILARTTSARNIKPRFHDLDADDVSRERSARFFRAKRLAIPRYTPWIPFEKTTLRRLVLNSPRV